MLTDEAVDRSDLEDVAESESSTEQHIDDDLSPTQADIIRLNRAKFDLQYRDGVSPKQAFSATPDLNWMLFLLGWPATGFRILELQQIFGEVDDIFINEFELNMYGILTPFEYFSSRFSGRVASWREDIDLLIQGVGLNRLWDFREIAQKPEHGDLCQEIARDLELMEEPIKSKLLFILEGAQVRSQLLTESLETLDRIAAIRKEERKMNLRRRRNVSNSEHPEADKETTELEPQLPFPSPRTMESVAHASGIDQGTSPKLPVPAMATRGNLTDNRNRLASMPLSFPATMQRNARAPSTRSNRQRASQNNERRGVHLFIDRIAHRTAVLFLFPLILAISAGLTAVSTTRSRSSKWRLDDGFFTCSSPACLQLFSLYLLILPILRRRALEIPKDWFVLSICLSMLSAIVSVIVYPFSWEASSILGFCANVAATVATVQLIEGTDAEIRTTLGPFYSD